MGRWSRRGFLASAWAARGLIAAEGDRHRVLPSEWQRYADPTTELTVYRLTDPAHASVLPAPYNRAIAHSSNWMVYASDREGSMQAYRMDLKSGETRAITEVEGLVPSTLTLTPDNRSLCYVAGRSICTQPVLSPHHRPVYDLPEGWEWGTGMSVGPDGTHATFVETKAGQWRLRMALLAKPFAHTVIERDQPVADPIHRPMRAQILYSRGEDELWLADSDGRAERQLKLAAGKVRGANWSHDGRAILYLNLPAEAHQLNAIRECAPDANTDRLVSKTSQFASFGFNHDSSVFVGASANRGAPSVLLLLRVTRREFTLCDHRAADAAAVNPVFAPDSQRIYFTSDREGKAALYSMHVERLVEKTED